MTWRVCLAVALATGVCCSIGAAAAEAAPETNLDSTPAPFTNDTTPSFSFSSTPPGATFECRVQPDSFAACTSPFTTTTLAENVNPYTFEVFATDGGDPDLTPAEFSFVVDITDPDTVIDSAAHGLTSDATPTFAFHAVDANADPATFQCWVDLQSPAPCSGAGTHTTATLGDGSHTFNVAATDQAGNSDPSPDTETFTVDATGPAVTLTAPAGGSATNDTTPDLSGAAGDASGDEDQVTVKIYAGSSATGSPVQSINTTRTGATWSTSAATLADGTYTAQAEQSDGLGHTSQSSANTFKVDTVAPQTTITPPAHGFVNSAGNPPTFNFTSNEAGGTFECRVDLGSFTACTSPHTTASLADGSRTFEVRAIDQAGNVDLSAASETFTVDTVAPIPTITSTPLGQTHDNTPTFDFTANDTATFQCWVDSRPKAPCTSHYTQLWTGGAPLPDGPHTFHVRAKDLAGNEDGFQDDTENFTVDANGPTVTLTTPANGSSSQDTTPTLGGAAGTASGDDTDVTVKLYSGSAATGTPIQTITTPATGSSWSTTAATLADGTYTAQAEQGDNAGNTGQSSASTFKVDNQPPQPTITSSPHGTTIDPTPSFSFTSNEPGSTFQCGVDEPVPTTPCTSPNTTSSLTDGSHTFYVRATDPAGNTSTADTETFTVNATAPVASFNYSPASPLVGQNVTFISTSTDNGSVVAWEWELDQDDDFNDATTAVTSRTFPAAGNYIVKLRVTDNEGKQSTVTRTIAVKSSVTGGGGPPAKPALLNPFPVVRISGSIKKKGTKISRLTVDAPAGVKITVSCKGKGCPFKQSIKTVAASRSASVQAVATGLIGFTKLKRTFKPGVVIEVRATKAGAIGKYTRFQIRKRKAPKRMDRCLMPNQSTPTDCPAS